LRLGFSAARGDDRTRRVARSDRRQSGRRLPRPPTAPEIDRVDLGTPIFSNPTNVTNPLFPISRLFRVILLGQVEGLPFRAETTLLPDTRTIDLDGKPVETLVSQYAAFLDGRIHEIALDFYAQADDGAAWYFGEDVFNYEDGLIADTEGTWLAGRDGPAAMIMPANPEVGNVWRPENICELVFEEVTAKATGVTVDGPHGPVQGAIVVQELHMDGALEDKAFAPGYGEFSTGDGSDLEAVALAVPEDALPGLPPKDLEALSAGGIEIFDAAQAEEWKRAAATVEEMGDAWDRYKEGQVPPMLEAQMDDALEGWLRLWRPRSQPTPGRPPSTSRGLLWISSSGTGPQPRPTSISWIYGLASWWWIPRPRTATE
jgi:hypothetical protein